MMCSDVTVVVDAQDDLYSTHTALQAHCPEAGCITVQPTPANSSPTALAHDMLYALEKRLASGPNTPDAWLDSVDTAWLAAAAWAIAAGVRHVVVPRAHLLTSQRIDQLLAWRERAGAQLTLLWQKAPRGLPPGLARVERHISGPDQLEALLAAPRPLPARPFLPLAAPTMAEAAAVGARVSPAPPRRGTRSARVRPSRQDSPCTGAMATAQVVEPAPAAGITSGGASALTTLAHPLMAGALSVLAFTQVGLGSLRFTRDLDITGDVSVIKTHGPGHRHCPVHVIPAWARPLLAAARAHHRLTGRSPTDHVFAPAMLADARHLRAHAERLPHLNLAWTASLLVP
ncbi:hypothetical protein ACGFYA_29875 [Streptomyces sp. NPDC048305]|uniref:hypothetical protein n=1 Tax=Streptomyces sp. NPDC048305 TaxID=3365532 RepID=UPI0037108DEA